MGEAVHVKKGDHNRLISDTLLLNGSPLDLTGASVICVLRVPSGREVFRRTATIVGAATNGDVEYNLTSTDLAEAGQMWQEWEVTLASGKIITYPADSFNFIEISFDLT